MLVSKKGTPVGRVDEFNGSFDATKINWSTGETKFIGQFGTFAEAKKAILK